MNDLISRKALIAEYDRVHIGPPGGARKLMEDAPAVDAVILPCKLGDTVWTILYGKIQEAKVNCIRPFVFKDFVEFRGDAVITMAHPFYSDGRTLTHDPFIIFGKDTFLTREEAEAALAKMRGGVSDG